LASDRPQRREFLPPQLTEMALAEARDELLLESAQALVAAVEAKDPYTRNHSLNVSGLAVAMGRALRLPPRLLATLRIAAMLHDVGKIGVPDAILQKAGPLSIEEFEIIKTHPRVAVRILSPVRLLADVRRIILHHHERFDGTGYPTGLRAEQIPIGARILSVADAVDAMLSPRSYKSAYPLERVCEELADGAARQFDPVVTGIALECLSEKPGPRTPAVPS
jgi:putative nucleotidyltransferase with HDIG domain